MAANNWKARKFLDTPAGRKAASIYQERASSGGDAKQGAGGVSESGGAKVTGGNSSEQHALPDIRDMVDSKNTSGRRGWSGQ